MFPSGPLSTISLVLWGKELTLPRNRGLWAGDMFGGAGGDTRAVTPLAWRLPLEPQPSLKIQPKSNFNKVWKPSLGDAHRTLPCEVGGQGALSLPGSHPHPTKPARLPTMHPPGLTTDSPRDTVHSPDAQEWPQVPLGGVPPNQGHCPRGSGSLRAAHSRPFLATLTSALWKQLLLEGLSISLFLQEINTPHKVNGGFRQERLPPHCQGRALLGANDRSASTRQTAGAAGRRRGRANEPARAGLRGPGPQGSAHG